MRLRLIPSNDQFFVLFSSSASNLAKTAEAFQAMLADFDRREEHHQTVRQLERTGDDFTKEILRQLDTSFVTPFDREDIHNLAEHLDHVVDDVYHTSEVLTIVPVANLLPEFLQQVDVLVRIAGRLVELIDRLPQMKGLRPLLDEIDELESEGDRVYRSALRRLFSGELEALEVLKWKDLIESAELAIDGVEDVSDIVATILFKHA